MGVYLLIMLIEWITDLFTLEKKKETAMESWDTKVSIYEKELLDELDAVLKSMEQDNLEWAKNLLSNYKIIYRALFDETEQMFKAREDQLTVWIRQNQFCLGCLTDLQKEYF